MSHFEVLLFSPTLTLLLLLLLTLLTLLSASAAGVEEKLALRVNSTCRCVPGHLCANCSMGSSLAVEQ